MIELRWITNVHPDWMVPEKGETQKQANQRLIDEILAKRLLAGKPKATEAFSTEDLERIGMVGIYVAAIAREELPREEEQKK